ncbi:hypothetical protein [Mesorhizobium sp. ES1-6]|uniref:hypothetical protein n=1 Tax=Mesorhizobium sp. ES1-6 TaxID=2876626 RepID=UPI0029622075|nr:hypothetical protein [Mesorhizobium sp. ES1-6]
MIYSITTSSHADAPQGMEFLYTANHLNVANSRAKALCILSWPIRTCSSRNVGRRAKCISPTASAATWKADVVNPQPFRRGGAVAVEWWRRGRLSCARRHTYQGRQDGDYGRDVAHPAIVETDRMGRG